MKNIFLTVCFLLIQSVLLSSQILFRGGFTQYPTIQDSLFYTASIFEDGKGMSDLHLVSNDKLKFLFDNLSKQYLENQILHGEFWEIERALAVISVLDQDTSFVPAIGSLLKNKNELLVCMGTRALSKIKSESSIKFLQSSLLSFNDYKNDFTIVTLLNSLQYLPDRRSMPIIVEFSDKYRKSSRKQVKSILQEIDAVSNVLETYFSSEHEKETLLIERISIEGGYGWGGAMIKNEPERAHWIELLRHYFENRENDSILVFRNVIGETQFTEDEIKRLKLLHLLGDN